MTLDADFVDLVRAVLPDLPDGAAIGPDTDLRAAGLDSMASIDLLMRVEARYGVGIPDTALTGATFATPGSFWAVVQQQRAG